MELEDHSRGVQVPMSFSSIMQGCYSLQQLEEDQALVQVLPKEGGAEAQRICQAASC